MKVLLDHNIPVQLARLLVGHEVFTARQMGWDLLGNGYLLKAAEDAGFTVMITGDKSIVYQQNNAMRRIALIVVSTTDRPLLVFSARLVADALTRVGLGSYELVVVPR